MQSYIDDSRQDDRYISTDEAAALLGTTNRWVREQIKRGVYRADVYASQLGGGADGVSYNVDVHSLPTEAQLTHALSADRRSLGVDMVAYRERFGQVGIDELLGKLHAVQETLLVIDTYRYDRRLVAMKQEIADRMGVDVRTLYRWCQRYKEQGIAGIMDKIEYVNKGRVRTMCSFSKDYVTHLLTAKYKYTSRDVYRRLSELADTLGCGACERCPYNEGTEARQRMLEDGNEADYPLCDNGAKDGLVIPAGRHAIDRWKNMLPKSTIALGQRGVKYWQAKYMPKAQREKPAQANALWFGDHHQFDLFVLDSDGRPVRPWLTAFSDAASGCFPAWRLSLTPNSKTITDAFVDGVMYKEGSPFYGVPEHMYMDNGKDYRSHRFEGGVSVEDDLGHLNQGVEEFGLLKILHVKVTHALPYRAWSKPIERLFGTIEDQYIRGLPGWCGNSPQDRPETFSRDLKRQLERGELLTFQEFADYWRDTILPTYHSTRPDEGGKAPLEIFDSLPRYSEDVPDWSVLSLARSERVTRKIQSQGIRLANILYWDNAMAAHVDEEAVVLYDEDDRSSVTVMIGGHHLCEARIKERLKMVDEDPDIIAAHMAMQHQTQRSAGKPIKQSRGTMEYAQLNSSGDRIQKRKGSKTVPLELRKAAAAREDTKRQLREDRDGQRQDNALREKFRAAGAALNASKNA